MRVFRVPAVYHRSAILAILENVAFCGINKLQRANGRREFDPPPRYQTVGSRQNALGSLFAGTLLPSWLPHTPPTTPNYCFCRSRRRLAGPLVRAKCSTPRGSILSTETSSL